MSKITLDDVIAATPGSQNNDAAEGTGLSGLAGSIYRGARDLVTGESRTEFPDVPELGTLSGGLSYDGLAALSANEAEQARMAAQLTGGVPSQDKFGNQMLTIENQPYYINKPGISGRDIKDITAQGAMFIPAGRAAGAAVKAGSKSMLAGASSLAAGTQVASDIVTNAAGAQVAPGEQVVDTALAAVTGPLGAGGELGATVAQARNFPYGQLEAQGLARNAQDVGVGLTASQYVGGRNAETRGQLLREMDETASPMERALGRQDAQVENAAQGVLEMLPETDVPSGILAQRTSQEARDAMVREREEATGALYDAMRQDPDMFSTQPLLDDIADIQNSEQLVVSGDSFQALERVKRLLGQQEIDVRVPTKAPGTEGQAQVVKQKTASEYTLGNFLNAREELNTLITQADEKGNAQLSRRLLMAKEQLDNTLINLSDDFKAANDTFQALSGPINELDQGLAGMVLNMPAAQLDYVAKTVFSPSATPTARQNLKLILDEVNPDAYPALLRSHMSDKLMSLRDGGMTTNMPNQYYNALWGSKAIRDMYTRELSQVSPEAAEYYTALGEVLKAARTGRGNNSNTAIKQEMLKEFNVIPDLMQRGLELFTGLGAIRGINGMLAPARKEQALADELSTLTGDLNRLSAVFSDLEGGSARQAMRNIVVMNGLLGGLTIGEQE